MEVKSITFLKNNRNKGIIVGKSITFLKNNKQKYEKRQEFTRI